MKAHRFLIVGAVLSLGLAAGCGSSRDVEVTGEVNAGSLKGEIVLEFFDIVGDSADAELTSVHTLTMDSVGEFAETVSLEGDRLMVRALDDADGDGACTDGEAWAEQEADVVEDKVEGISLTLEEQPCPTTGESGG